MQGSAPPAPSRRSARWALFAGVLLACAWFHPGGGWNQNVRFAQVRALVHDHSFAIDDQLLHTLEAGAGGAHYRTLRLSDPTTRSARAPRAVSLDVSEHAGHLYPNKPPGLTLLALPGYVVASALTGGDHDWWSLTLALYLTSLLSVGVVAALGALAFHDVARRLFPDATETARLLATAGYALGTPVFAYATFLIDHTVVASLSLFAFRELLVAKERGGAAGRLFAAGTLAGMAVLVNNSAALTALGLGAYALATLAPRRRAWVYAAGGVLPALGLAAYQQACFGSPFALPQHYQLGFFAGDAPVLGIFGAPRLDLLPKLLFLPYRGLFFWAPLLAAGALALVPMLRRPGQRAEALLFLGLSLAYLLMNASFNAWHGGGTFGPRYLVPAVPFLALPLVRAFERWRAATGVLAAVSIALALLVNAVGPQVDAAEHRPLTGFYLPLVRGGTVESAGHTLRGPVSVHPAGFVGAGIEARAGTTAQARWSSFNLGEALFPGSLWSLAPLLVALGGLAALAGRRLRDG